MFEQRFNDFIYDSCNMKYLLNRFFFTCSLSELYLFSIAHLFVIFRFSEVFLKSSLCSGLSLSDIVSNYSKN